MAKKPTVGVAIIARNSGKTIHDCVKSVTSHVDQIVVVLAGESTDNTAQEARRGSKKVELFKFNWVDDFAAARNFSFSKIHTDWCLWIDSDDQVYQPENLRKLISEAPDDVGGLWFPYHYAIDEFGNVTTLYERERLFRMSFGWIWRGRLHETVEPLKPCKFARTDDVIIRHNHLAGGDRNERNFKLLEIMLKEEPGNKRIWLYLGHQNFAANNQQEAAKWYLKFGSDNGALPIERYQALCYCSKALRMINDPQAVDVAIMAMEIFPNYRDAYMELANCYLTLNDYDKALHWATIVEEKELIKEAPHIIFINPLEFTHNRFNLIGECYLKKGMLEKALEYLQKGFAIRPTEAMKQNVQYITELWRRQRVSTSVKTLAVELLDNQELVKLPHLLEVVPFWMRDTSDFEQLKQGVEHYTMGLISKPILVESNSSVVVDISNVQDPKNYIMELDRKYNHVKITAQIPSKDSKILNVYSLRDMKQIITSGEGRHIINLQREKDRVWAEYDKNIPDKLSVRMYLGQGLEEWNPGSIKQIGCGGAETAAYEIAKGLAVTGCQPIIYAMDNQVWDGVVFIPHTDFTPDKIPCHLFISSRVADVFYSHIPAKQRWLWLHDIHRWDKITPEVVSQLDTIVVLSKWHATFTKNTYPFLGDAEIIDFDNNPLTYEDIECPEKWYVDARANKLPKIAIVGHGIDTARFETLTEGRIPHRFIWASSPDRGLEHILEMWPLIRKEWPDAELKIFYGWDYFDNYLVISPMRDFKIKMLKMLKQPGIEWVGRIGQNQLAKEMMKADIWLYPPPHSFRETYCITALEAQAAGVLCIYRQNGALGETIGDRGIPLRMDMSQEDIVKTIIETGKNSEYDRIRERAREYAMGRTWQKQADKFLALYERLDAKNRCD